MSHCPHNNKSYVFGIVEVTIQKLLKRIQHSCQIYSYVPTFNVYTLSVYVYR